jgi:hypothetical protein
MPLTYSPNLRITLIGNGEQAGTWGDLTNINLGTLLEQGIAGYGTVSITDADFTLTTNNGAVDQARSMALNITSSVTLSATRNVICPSVSKLYVVRNATTGGQSIVIKTSAGLGITIANGATAIVLCNGTDVIDPSSSKQAALGYTPVNKAGDTMSGGLGFTGSATRIQGDFDNGTLVNRTAFQSTTTNGTTAVGALPNGTATSSGWIAFNNSNPTNAGYIGIDSNSTVSRIVSANTGSGTAVPLTFNVGAAGPEVARFDTSGRFCLGVTSGSTIAGAVNALGYASRSGSSGSFSGNVYNLYWNGTGLEAWVDTGSLGVINTTSDYRIKQNVVTQNSNAVDRVNALRPVTYQIKDVGIFKADGVTREGFIAHELAEVIPSAVNGTKDALTEDGNIQPQSLRLDPIIAVLTKAIQELSARVAALEAK